MSNGKKNYKVSTVGNWQAKGRVTLNSELALTGSEISLNELPAGVSVPFVHSHKRNEEVYVILKGKGQFYIDGDEFKVEEGNVIRVDSLGERCITADSETPIQYICIQTEANSLIQSVQDDANILKSKPSWLM